MPVRGTAEPASFDTVRETIRTNHYDAERNVHRVWDGSLEPVLTIEDGDVVRFECRDAVDRQLDVESTAEEFADVSFDPVHPLTGPVAIEGADPGDVLKISEVVDAPNWTVSAYIPESIFPEN